MLLLAHIGITAFVATLLYLPAVFSIVGVLLPDIIDKVLFMSGVSPCGRFFGHSIFFTPILGAVTYLITKRKDFAFAIMLGSSLHLIEDIGHFIPLLYPLKTYAFASICGPIKLGFGMFNIVTEGLGAALIILTFAFNSKLLYFRDKMWSRILKNRNKKVLYDKNRKSARLLQNKERGNRKKVG